MQFKEGVDRRGVHPRLWTILPWIDRMHHAYTSEDMVITDMRRPWNPEKASKHSPISPPQRDGYWLLAPQWDEFCCSASDLRRWALDATRVAEEFCRYIQREHGDELGVVLEPEWLTAEQIRERGGIEKVVPHIHLQLKFPVMWELWG